jgi:hypothetical protein
MPTTFRAALNFGLFECETILEIFIVIQSLLKLQIQVAANVVIKISYLSTHFEQHINLKFKCWWK